MSKNQNWWKDILKLIVEAFLLPLATALGSYLTTGNWMKWFKNIYTWIVFGAVIFGWIIIKRFKQLKAHPRGILGREPPLYGWIEIAKFNYNGVKWIIRVPAPPQYRRFRKEDISPRDIYVATRPRCPECGTELQESPSFWGKYNWKCVGCRFKKRRQDSFVDVSLQVEKIVRRKAELGEI